MEKLHVIKEIKHTVRGLLWYFVLQGVMLIVLGVLVMQYPQILILLFAVFFILAGVSSLFAAMRVSSFARQIDRIFRYFE